MNQQAHELSEERARELLLGGQAKLPELQQLVYAHRNVLCKVFESLAPSSTERRKARDQLEAALGSMGRLTAFLHRP